VDYFIELLGLHNCAGCRFYRAEGRGHLWDAQGDRMRNVWPSCIRGNRKAYFVFLDLPFGKDCRPDDVFLLN
jgi:hypothetical protein